MIRKLAWTAAIALAAGSAAAQVPPDIAASIRAAGQSMDPSTGQAYAPLFADEAYQGITLTRDAAYGDDPLQKLDLYVPEAKADRPLPVLLFVHGGGFVRGDKHGPFYPDNITAWAARNGMVGVNVNYRLAPDVPWPAAARDIGAAIAWVRANIAQHGGDPDHIVLWGHSAGANHVSDYIGHRQVQGAEAQAVKGAVLLSAFYAPALAEPHAYYGSDRDLAEAAPAIERLRRSGVPLFVGYAQYDPDMMRTFSQTAIAELCKAPETCPASVNLADHNHFTEGMAVGTGDVSLSGPLLEWMRGLR